MNQENKPKRRRIYLLVLAIVVPAVAGISVAVGWAAVKRMFHSNRFDIVTLVDDARWTWGSGAPSCLVAGHFTSGKAEDVLVVGEPISEGGKLTHHLYRLPGGSAGGQASIDEPVIQGTEQADCILKAERPRDALVADMNGDGKLDMIIAYDAGIALLVNQGKDKLTFSANCLETFNASYVSVIAVDINADGRLDLLTLDNTRNSLEARDAGRFGIQPSQVVIADWPA